MKKILIEFINGGPRIFSCNTLIEVSEQSVAFGPYNFTRKGIKKFFVQDKKELHESNYKRIS